MGTSSVHFYDGVEWHHEVPAGRDWLRLEVYDSDIAVVTFPVVDDAQGLVFLGYQPRDYFDDPSASPELDLDSEVSALADWVTRHGGSPDVIVARGLVAEVGAEPSDDFVEETVAKLLDALAIPLAPLV